ncbi:hypothetical protein BBP40_007187 [Aspergillus hancockii]|nr:hypothetical protein BBP40_007187 [Aspergillus hancockii]
MEPENIIQDAATTQESPYLDTEDDRDLDPSGTISLDSSEITDPLLVEKMFDFFYEGEYMLYEKYYENCTDQVRSIQEQLGPEIAWQEIIAEESIWDKSGIKFPLKEMPRTPSEFKPLPKVNVTYNDMLPEGSTSSKSGFDPQSVWPCPVCFHVKMYFFALRLGIEDLKNEAEELFVNPSRNGTLVDPYLEEEWPRGNDEFKHDLLIAL